MGSVFDSLKRTARTGRLKAELLLHEREIRQRQEAFGVTLYEHLEPLSKHANFFSADDRLTTVLRPPLIESQREIAVVYNKQTQLKERMKQAEAKRAAAFPKRAENWQEKLSNAAKSTALAGGETKLKAEMVVLDAQIKGHKQKFGTALYPLLEGLEDSEGWLPTDREVRRIYDDCRRDIEAVRKKCQAKMDEMESLGVSRQELEPTPPPPSASLAMAPVLDASQTAAPRQPAVAAATATPPPEMGGFAASDTPVLAYAAPAAAAPVAAPPSLAINPAAAHAGPANPAAPPGLGGGGGMNHTMGNPASMGPMGGTPMGGAGALPPSQSVRGIGDAGSMMGSSVSSFADNVGGPMGGGAGMGTAGPMSDEAGGFAMGGQAGMGTTPLPPPQQQHDPWANNNHSNSLGPFAPPPSAPMPPPPQQPQQQAQHPDSNLFLY